MRAKTTETSCEMHGAMASIQVCHQEQVDSLAKFTSAHVEQQDPADEVQAEKMRRFDQLSGRMDN